MNIFDTRQAHSESVTSSIGQTVLDFVTIPFDFVAEVVHTPFDFVKDTVGGVTSKVVIIGVLAIAGLYIVSKSGVLKGKL